MPQIKQSLAKQHPDKTFFGWQAKIWTNATSVQYEPCALTTISKEAGIKCWWSNNNILYITPFHITTLSNIALYNTTLCNTELHNITLWNTALHNITLYSTELNNITLYNTALHNNAVYKSALRNTETHYTAPCCTSEHCPGSKYLKRARWLSMKNCQDSGVVNKILKNFTVSSLLASFMKPSFLW